MLITCDKKSSMTKDPEASTEDTADNMSLGRRSLLSLPEVEPELEYRSFARNATERASTGTLKQARLPGAEKFKFALSTEDINRRSVLTPTLPHRRSYRLSSSGSTNGLGAQHQCDSKRRPILPISKNTSRVLNNTNAELSADTIEFIRSETSHLSLLCQKYTGHTANQTEDSQSDEWSRSSSDQSLEQTIPSAKDRLKLQSLKTQEERREDCFDRRTTHEPNNNCVQPFASIRSNRLRSTRAHKFSTPSPTHSTCSSTDDDIWVLRTDQKH